LYAKEAKMSSILGIDVSKAKLDVALISTDTIRQLTVPNTSDGHDKLCDWLVEYADGPLHACLEATGRYGQAVAAALHSTGYKVSVVNPAQIKAFAGTLLVRSKTDAIDALLIARYCQMHQPPAWNPPDPAQIRLKELSRHRRALQNMCQQQRNRLKAGCLDPDVALLLLADIDHFTAQIRAVDQLIRQHIRQHASLKRQVRLLCSIPGIGFITAVALLAEIAYFATFTSPRQLVAYAGLDPRHRSSGSSVHHKTSISKRGNAHLRAALYFPAIAAKKHNPLVQPLVKHMMQAGHCPMSIVAAVMRKLLHYAFAILRSGQPFDPNYLVFGGANA